MALTEVVMGLALIALGVVALIAVSLYALLKMPRCPVCDSRKRVSFCEFAGYYCHGCEEYFGEEEHPL